jgi:hypothetical protein
MSKNNNKEASEQMKKDWSMKEIKVTEYEKLFERSYRLEQIENADGGEAMKILRKLATIPLQIDETHFTTLSSKDDFKDLENYILNLQHQVKEHEELKEKHNALTLQLEKYFTLIYDKNDKFGYMEQKRLLLNSVKKMVGVDDE